ncbi:nucleotide sugar dehydrogenase [Pseudonocardia lacus]|uniref:nucleotide sugar dehydrogenase n=1 Tax=Pseudonocardia lacus TaxID=2835865 RepID=UPI001BDCC31C|nr:nucleotide sugar dehydrogenase [Pseudonocardia lacus]
MTTLPTKPTLGSGTGQKVVVVGQGYVGLPIAMRAVEAGFDVVGVDVDDVRVAALAAGESYVEDVDPADLRAALASGRYRPTADYALADGFDAAIITVPTPLRDALPDLSFIQAAAEELAPRLERGATVVLESTTYPGTTEELLVPLLERGSRLAAGREFHVGYSPERIDPGNRRWRLVNTPKVVSGINEVSLRAVEALYGRLVDRVIPVSGCKEAELTKLLENTFRHVNIALVNEIAMFAHELGVDVWEAIDAASTKPFGFLRFTPGPGVGGHCLPVDPTYLSWEVRRRLGRSFRFVELANDVNDHMPDHVVLRITAGLNARRKAVCGSTVLVLGLAYKPNTGDIRESPALRVVELLTDLGARVQVVDSHIEAHRCPPGVRLVQLTPARVQAADAVVVLTDHDDVDYGLLADAEAWVLDTRRRLTGKEVEYL